MPAHVDLAAVLAHEAVVVVQQQRVVRRDEDPRTLLEHRPVPILPAVADLQCVVVTVSRVFLEEQATVTCLRLYSYGLYSYGLCSYGL